MWFSLQCSKDLEIKVTVKDGAEARWLRGLANMQARLLGCLDNSMVEGNACGVFSAFTKIDSLTVLLLEEEFFS